MPHFPKPFFRASRDSWYVQIRGKQVNLGRDREQAFRQYHDLMRVDAQQAGPSVAPAEGFSVVTVLDLFLDWCQKNKAARTYEWYLTYLQSFIDAIPAKLAIADLRPYHVQQWVDGHAGWKTGRRGAITSVQRAMNWAVKFGHVTASPVRQMEKPPQGRREQLVSGDEYARILTCAPDEAFRDLLVTAWETGARPHELFTVEARHIDQARDRWVFPVAESKGKKHSRVVYLTPTAAAITRRRAAAWTQGPIFRNTEGVRWHPYAINCRFCRIKKKLGVRYSLYAFRHSWCTRALETGGLDAVTVSVLMGHRDTTMISRVYSHLTQRTDHLRNAVAKTGS